LQLEYAKTLTREVEAAAAAPAVSIAAEEDARLDEFLREIVAPSHQRFVPARRTSRAAALAVAANWLIIEAVRRSDLSLLGPINAYKPWVSLVPGWKGDSLLAATIANTQSNLVAFGV
jgi:hypothetical protein